MIVLAAVMLLAGTASAPHSAAAPTSALRVFAAASLADAFREIARTFERAHPGTTVQLNLAGSQQLATQLEQGAVADVFAPADERTMEHVRERSLVGESPPVFARNRLVVIVPRTNPARIGRLQDIARRGVKVVIGAEAVPVGAYSREVLRKLARIEGFVPEFERRVLANVVSEEENVTSVVGKVRLGEADAGIVYRSDVTRSLLRFVRALEIPDAANVVARYPIAVVRGAREPGLARAFVAWVLSSQGQRVIERHGLIPALPSP